MRAKVGDLVEVTWLDAWADHDATARRDWKDFCQVKTYGTLVRLTDEIVSVASESLEYSGAGDDEEFRCVTHVPRGMVVPNGIRVLA